MTAPIDHETLEEGATPAPSALYEFDEDFQRTIAALTLRDTTFVSRVEGLVQPHYFANDAQGVLVAIANEYYDKYKKAPDKSVLGTLIREAVASKRIRKDMVPEIKDTLLELLKTDISDTEFAVEKVAEFARHQAVEQAIIKSVSLHEKRDFAGIEKLIKEAIDIGAAEEAGEYDYWAEIKHRTEIRKEIADGTYKHDGITTGHADLDALLYHRGWGRKELSIFLAPAKGGKSMGLAEFAKNASLAGLNVIYFTLEVSAEITSDRMDAALSDVMMRELHAKPFEVEEKIEALSKKAGRLVIREYPSGTFKPSQMRRVLKHYRAKGVKFDLIVVDYADIMAPDHRSDDPIENSKEIYLSLRAIAHEEHAAVLSATQSNRDGAKSTTVKATDVAEDYNRVRIADIVISINANSDERTAGEARLFFAAVRNGEDGYSIRIKQDRSRMKFLTKIVGRE